MSGIRTVPVVKSVGHWEYIEMYIPAEYGA